MDQSEDLWRGGVNGISVHTEREYLYYIYCAINVIPTVIIIKKKAKKMRISRQTVTLGTQSKPPLADSSESVPLN